MSTEDEFNTGDILSQTQNDDSIPVKKKAYVEGYGCLFVAKIQSNKNRRNQQIISSMKV